MHQTREQCLITFGKNGDKLKTRHAAEHFNKQRLEC